MMVNPSLLSDLLGYWNVDHSVEWRCLTADEPYLYVGSVVRF